MNFGSNKRDISVLGTSFVIVTYHINPNPLYTYNCSYESKKGLIKGILRNSAAFKYELAIFGIADEDYKNKSSF